MARSRPSRPTREVNQPKVIRAEDQDSPADPMEVVLGFVWALVIPLFVYLGLTLLGMPPGGGGQGASWEEQMRRNEEVIEVRPAVTYVEIQMRLDRVQELLQDRVPDYLRRANQTDDNRVKNQWQELAFSTLGICDVELKQVEDDVPNSESLGSRRGEVEQAIRRWRSHIASEENKIIRNNPFPDRLTKAREALMAERE